MSKLTQSGNGKRGKALFKSFLDGRGISENDEKIPMLKDAWNYALGLASQHFNELEGTSFEVVEIFEVKDGDEE